MFESVIEPVALQIRGGSAWSNEPEEIVEITWSELKSVGVGHRWTAGRTNVLRATREMEAVVLFKDEAGCLVRVTEYWWPDKPYFCSPEVTVRLIYFAFRQGQGQTVQYEVMEEA